MFNRLTSNKKDFIIFIFFCFGLLTYIFLSSRPKSTSSKPVNIIPKLVSTYPPQPGKHPFDFPGDAIVFTYNIPLDIEKVFITIAPEIYFDKLLADDKYSIYIRPQKNWKYNTEYTVTVTGILSDPTIFKFTPVKPEITGPMGVYGEKGEP